MKTQLFIRQLKKGKKIQTEIGTVYFDDQVPVSVFVVKKKLATLLSVIK